MPLEVFMKSISSLYKDYLRKDLIIFDEKQLEIVSKIKGIIPKKFGIRERIIKLFYQRRNISKGIYLWGKAGSGKTMIMDMCFSVSNIKGKQRIHFQEFMIDIHNRLHEIRKNTNIKDPLNLVAREISSEVDFLCFDEFQVNDIADASILDKLFNLMLENGTFIFVTSNIIPKELYKDGLQRDRFIPFIKLIENKFLNLELSTNKDYRRDKLQNVNTYFSKLNN